MSDPVRTQIVGLLVLARGVARKCVMLKPNTFLARLYESTGRAIAITPASALALASALASALLKMLKFLVKVFIRLYLLNMSMD